MIVSVLFSGAKVRLFSHIGTRNKVKYAHFTDILHFGICFGNLRKKRILAFWLEARKIATRCGGNYSTL